MEEFLKSVQLDRWTFRGLNSTGVVSHPHGDHDPTVEKCTFVPSEIFVHERFYSKLYDPTRTTVKAVNPRRGRRIKGKIYGYPFLARDLKRALDIEVPDQHLHSSWWVFKRDDECSIFIGDLDAPEADAVIKMMEKVAPAIAVLPTYSGLKLGEHRQAYDGELNEKMDKIFRKLEKEEVEVWTLPHPIRVEIGREVARKVC